MYIKLDLESKWIRPFLLFLENPIRFNEKYLSHVKQCIKMTEFGNHKGNLWNHLMQPP